MMLLRSSVSLVSVLNRLPFCLSHYQPISFVPLLRQFTSQTQSENTSINSCGHLKHVSLQDRSIIRISGPETLDFFQALVTNDVRLLFDGSGRRCIYSFMLNNSGRVVADMFIYNVPNRNDMLLLEVDFLVAAEISKLLKRYRIRKKIAIKPESNCQVTAIFSESPENLQSISLQSESEEQFVVQDPRCPHFGFRMITLGRDSSSSSLTATSTSELTFILAQQNHFFNSATLQQSDDAEYRTFRYRLGIGEGALDFPLETVFPFEANAELLNAVSFEKGCYIGQELTARTYHTGVIRKRYLPVELMVDSEKMDFSESLPTQNVISEQEEGNVRIMGRFRTNFKNNGLASLKYGELFNKDPEEDEMVPSKKCNTLKLAQSGFALRTWRPFWWPESI